jgi:hypothetical protein
MRETWRRSALGRARKGWCQAEARLQTALEKSSSQSGQRRSTCQTRSTRFPIFLFLASLFLDAPGFRFLPSDFRFQPFSVSAFCFVLGFSTEYSTRNQG